jgi:hypothetical protein
MNDGNPYSMTVTATVYGAPSVAYQWQSSATGEDNEWSDIDNAISSYDAPTNAVSIIHYRCVVTTDCGSVFRKWTVTVTDCPGYVCTGCAYDYSSTYDNVSGDIAKGKRPTTTDTDESWAPNVQISGESYTANDDDLFSAFTSAGKDLCVYKTDGNSSGGSQQATWPNAVRACGTFDGISGWYLPNIRELRALYDALGGDGNSGTGLGSAEDDFAGGFAMQSNYYWSSTERAINIAHHFGFISGYRSANLKSTFYYVRCVRRM